jgi:hypothetical protein
MSASTLKRTNEAPASYREGYAIFARLCELNAQTAADKAYREVSILDDTLLDLGDRDPDRFFPSPYGGAILVDSVVDAIQKAATLMDTLSSRNIRAAIAITYGKFARVFSVNAWNATAFALNTAARMTASPEGWRQISVSQSVKDDALRANSSFQNAFGPGRHGQVKETKFCSYAYFHEIHKPEPKEDVAFDPNTTFGAHILVVDIERYSLKPPEDQQESVELLNRCLDDTITATRTQPDAFGPAGDGGYFVFRSGSSGSAPAALLFAHELVRHALARGVRIRCGIASGPVVQTKHRPAVGGTIILADEVSAKGEPFKLAATPVTWDDLAKPLRGNWHEQKRIDQATVLLKTGLEPDKGSTVVRNFLSNGALALFLATVGIYVSVVSYAKEVDARWILAAAGVFAVCGIVVAKPVRSRPIRIRISIGLVFACVIAAGLSIFDGWVGTHHNRTEQAANSGGKPIPNGSPSPAAQKPPLPKPVHGARLHEVVISFYNGSTEPELFLNDKRTYPQQYSSGTATFQLAAGSYRIRAEYPDRTCSATILVPTSTPVIGASCNPK